MKKVVLFLFAGLLVTSLIIKAKSLPTGENSKTNLSLIEYPENVKTVIDNKCYECHSVKGQSDDAKKALMWDDLPGLKLSDQISTLDEIIEVLEEGKMPPEKVIKKYPNMQLSAEEKKVLLSWAEETADNLME